jgi:hypothetical protein
MSKINALLANRDAVVAFIGGYNAEHNVPCPSKVIAENFVAVDIKKLLPLLKEDGAIASEKGRYGGYMTVDFANVRAANKAEKKTTPRAKKVKDPEAAIVVAKKAIKSAKSKVKTETVIPDGADLAGNVGGETVSTEEAQSHLEAVREIVKNYKKKPVETEIEEEEEDVKPLSFGPSEDEIAQIEEESDEEYDMLINDMNDIVSRNAFSEA